jgi:hypothetical protein
MAGLDAKRRRQRIVSGKSRPRQNHVRIAAGCTEEQQQQGLGRAGDHLDAIRIGAF